MGQALRTPLNHFLSPCLLSLHGASHPRAAFGSTIFLSGYRTWLVGIHFDFATFTLNLRALARTLALTLVLRIDKPDRRLTLQLRS